MQSPLDIKSYTPEFTLEEPYNRDVLQFLIGNPKKVNEIDPEGFLYGKLINIAQRLKLDSTLTSTYAQSDYDACRCYVQNCSLQNIDHRVRNPLVHGILFDLDIRNCHPVILCFLAQAHGFECTRLTDYIDRRSEVLTALAEQYKVETSVIKGKLLALLNGGGLRATPSCPHNFEDSQYMQRLRCEVVELTKQLLKIYPKYLSLKEGGSERSPLALLMQDIENWAIQIILPLLTEYEPAVVMFDGVMTRKQVPAAVAVKCCEVVANTIKIGDVKLQLELVDKPVPPLPTEWHDLTRFEKNSKETVKRIFSSYMQVKEQLERTTFKLRKPSCLASVSRNMSKDDTSEALQLFSVPKLKEAMMNVFYYTVHYEPPKKKDEEERPKKKSRKSKTNDDKVDDGKAQCYTEACDFTEKWLKDEDIKTYTRVDFLPRPLKCPDDVFNLWDGFAVERETTNDFDRALMEKWIFPFIKDIVCDGNEKSNNYLLNIMAQMMQEPGVRPNVAIVLLGEEGAGKNTFTALLVEMIGLSMCILSAVLKDRVNGRFACPTENHILGVFDEIKPEEMRQNAKFLLDLITGDNGSCEKKGVNGLYKVRNCLRNFFSTNDASRFMKVPAGDRRWTFIQASSSKIGQIENYWGPLRAVINRPGVRRALYDHLMARCYTGFNFQTERVETEMYRDSKLQSIPREKQFLRHWVMESNVTHDALRSAADGKVTHVYTTELFNKFTEWVNDSGSAMGKCTNYSMTVIGFGVILKNTPGFLKNKHHGIAASHTLDPKALVNHLKQCSLLVDTEVTWLLGSDYTKYSIYSEKLQAKAVEEAARKFDVMASKFQNEKR